MNISTKAIIYTGSILLFGAFVYHEFFKNKNIKYSDKSKLNKLDIYGDLSSKIKKPLIVMVHGGGFVAGDKKDIASNAELLASYGYIVAVVNYRLTDICVDNKFNDVAWLNAMQDVNAAIKYLVGSRKYPIDESNIFLYGESAGAITAVQLAFAKDKFNNLDIATKDIYKPVKYKIAGVGSVAGGITDDGYMNSEIPIVMMQNPSDILVNYNVGDSHILDCTRKTRGSKYIADTLDKTKDSAYHKLYTVSTYPTVKAHGIGGGEIKKFLTDIFAPFIQTIVTKKEFASNTPSVKNLSEV